MNCKPSCDPNM